MRICAYVQDRYAKQTYKNECMDKRQFAGLRVVIDAIERAGYCVEWAGAATVHEYDVVLVSITSDCDWWEFVKERLAWRKGNYKVVAGGAGVLHVAPFLPFVDCFALGRGELVMPELIRLLDGKPGDVGDSIIFSESFDANAVYHIAQADCAYPHSVELGGGKAYHEGAIGCNHKCLFCGYTWQRKFVSDKDYYQMSDSLFGGIEDKERALLDMKRTGYSIDFSKLRTTAIDGFSERLRFMVNKRISKIDLIDFLVRQASSPASPHQLKIYNICGYPTETIDDIKEFADTLACADSHAPDAPKQWSIVLHSTPFRAMPATPMACAPMSYIDYRGNIAHTLRDKVYKGGIFYQGRRFWAVESMGTDSLASVFLSAIAHRGSPDDVDNITRLCRTPKFWGASSAVKLATLEKYFDAPHLFGAFTAKTLPSRYLRTYAQVERMWPK